MRGRLQGQIVQADFGDRDHDGRDVTTITVCIPGAPEVGHWVVNIDRIDRKAPVAMPSPNALSAALEAFDRFLDSDGNGYISRPAIQVLRDLVSVVLGADT